MHLDGYEKLIRRTLHTVYVYVEWGSEKLNAFRSCKRTLAMIVYLEFDQYSRTINNTVGSKPQQGKRNKAVEPHRLFDNETHSLRTPYEKERSNRKR